MEGIGFLFLIIYMVALFITHCIFYLRFTIPFPGNPEKESNSFHIVLWSIIILLCASPFYFSKFGNKDINSLFCRHEFDFKGYVYAFPNYNYDKNYRLEADIHKIGSRYEVKRIYFSNGGYLDINNEYENDDPLRKNGKLSCDGYYDTNGKEWYFRFYGETLNKS